MAQVLGLSVAVGDCAQAFLQAPLTEKEEVWVWPPTEANTANTKAWKLAKTLPGLKGGPAAWGAYATEVKEQLYGLTPSIHDQCVHSNVKEKLWLMRHMDDYLVIGPQAKVKEITDDMAKTMLLRDVRFLEVGDEPVRFLGWMLSRTTEGITVQANQQLIDDIV
eukprot:4968872-Prorocentrum_lima.AAC.1